MYSKQKGGKEGKREEKGIHNQVKPPLKVTVTLCLVTCFSTFLFNT